jgi:hypothetical protein
MLDKLDETVAVFAIFHLVRHPPIAPVGTGWLYDLTVSYDLLLWIITGLAVLAAGVMVSQR